MTRRSPFCAAPAYLPDEFVVVHLAICTTTHIPGRYDLQRQQQQQCISTTVGCRCCYCVQLLGEPGNALAPGSALLAALPRLQGLDLLLPAGLALSLGLACETGEEGSIWQ